MSMFDTTGYCIMQVIIFVFVCECEPGTVFPKVKHALPQEEIEIGKRLRVFREQLRMPRTVFALELGISGERLASYEAGRVRLPWRTFAIMAEKFPINIFWLGTGEGESKSLTPSGPLYDVDTSSRETFSGVFHSAIKEVMSERGLALPVRVRALIEAMEELNFLLDEREIGVPPVDRFTRQRIAYLQKTMPDVLERLEKRHAHAW